MTLGSQSNQTWRSVTDGVNSPVANASYHGNNLSGQLEYGYLVDERVPELAAASRYAHRVRLALQLSF